METCGWKCPLRHSDERHFKFLLCRALMKENEDYTQISNAVRAACRHQYRCPRSGKQENTEAAKECYKTVSAAE